MYVLGTARPIQPRNQSKWENYRNKKTAETHISGERVRHFADDDKYSLQEMVNYPNELKSRKILTQHNINFYCSFNERKEDPQLKMKQSSLNSLPR